MAIIGNKPCPSCRSVGQDRTGDHLVTFMDGNSACARCHLMVTKKGVVKNWGYFSEGTEFEVDGAVPLSNDHEEEEEELEVEGKDKGIVITADSGVNDLTIGTLDDEPIDDRGIKAAVLKQFGIKFRYDLSEGSVTHHKYPITTGSGKKVLTYKVRDTVMKRFSVMESCSGKRVDLFGLKAYNKHKGMHVLLCEGELDAVSAHQMLSDKVPDIMCLSLPFGANSKHVSENLKFLEAQDSVTLCYDQDDAGYKNEEDTWKILPTVKVMRINEKDANDCLVNMKATHFANAYHHAESFKPKVLASIEAMDMDDCIAPVLKGLSYPWDSLTKMTYGMHPNQVIGLGAAPGAGKTTLVRGIQQHLMFHHKRSIGIFSLEERAEWTTRLLIGYIMNKPIHVPGTVYNKAEAEKIKKQLEGKAYFYEHQYYTGEWMEIEQMIRYLYTIGVREFFIDPLSSLVSHLTPSEANKYLSEAMYALSILVQQLDITVFHVNHLNTAESGKSHEGGAKVYASQFTGSRAQWRYSHGLIGAERNLLATDGTANIMTLRFLKDRAFGNTGQVCQLEYNKATGRLEDVAVKF